MNTTMIKIILILIFGLSISANAQYEESIKFSSIESYLKNKILFGDVYKNTSEIMKMNIKKAKLLDDTGRLLNETTADKNGRITGFKSYDEDGSIRENITTEYDIKDNLTGITYWKPSGKILKEIELSYVGNTLLSHKIFLNSETPQAELFEHGELRYDDASDRTKLTGFDSHLYQGDSIPYAVNFKYDEYKRLNDVRVVQDITAIYSVSYSGDTVKIISSGGYESYVVSGNRIMQQKIYSAALSFTGELAFSYNENGMIEKIILSDNLGNKYMQRFEYDYYH